ncbi:outer membrane protein assembly factor BamB [Candidatus Rariloculus sp.]|uniref:outer membrane protein assembly factor BamB n=1 Tax=Candidatus Rariloculus sp. TaxID=3101265 RepID=UPI003D0E0C35
MNKLPIMLIMPVALLGLGGCGVFGGGDDTVEQPAELTAFDSSLRVRRVWSTRIGSATERLRLGLRPATDGTRIYAGAHDGSVESLDAETGRSQWSVETELPLSSGPGFGAGVLVFGTNDGELLALDATNGEERWRVAVGSEVLAPPAVTPNVVVFRSVDGRLRGVSSEDGSPIWSVEQSLPALTLRGNTAPYIAGSIVISGFSNGRVGAYDLSSGERLWELQVANPAGRNELERLVDVSAGLQVVGNDVYTVSYQGRALGIDLRNGIVIWQQEMSSYAGLGVDLNNVYVTSDVDAVVAIDRQTGTQIWSQEALRLRDVTAPTRYGQAVVVGDFEGYLHWLDPNDGRFLARTRAASDRIIGAPLVSGLNLYVQADDGSVAAFEVVNESG